MSMQQRMLVGVDDGYADTKTAAQSGCIVIPSRARHLAPAESGAGGLGGAAAYLIDSARIKVDPTIDGESTRFAGYHTSDLNLAIVHHALCKAGLAGAPVALAVGLPLSEFYDTQGHVNGDLLEAKRANLMRKVVAENGSGTAIVETVHVMAQSICAWINHAMDSKGRVASSRRPIGVVDIGGGTMDAVVVLPPNRIDPARSGTRQIGVMDVHALVASEIRGLCRISHVPSQMVQIAVKHGVYVHENEKIDVRKIVVRAKRQVAESILKALRDVMGRVDDLESLLFVGGGYGVMPWVSEPFANAVAVESPAYANARGMYKYLRFVEYG
jgi:plasmid segregation protein ParM